MPSSHAKLLRSQWVGTIVLTVAVVVLIIGLSHKQRRLDIPVEIADSLRVEESKIAKRDIPLRMHRFDPNTVDSAELIELGFSPWQAKSFLNYRRAGKRWYRKEQLQSLYGMTDSMYAALSPYVAIDTMPFYVQKQQRLAERHLRDSLRRDSLQRQWDSTRVYPTHIKKDTILDLNAADTAALQYIRGIGKFTAVQIIRYREQLGGYASVSQLHEIAAQDKRLLALDTLDRFFYVTMDSIRPIYVNKASIRTLAKHPYLTYTQAEQIYSYRRGRKSLKTIEDLRVLPAFDTIPNIDYLIPYLRFD